MSDLDQRLRRARPEAEPDPASLERIRVAALEALPAPGRRRRRRLIAISLEIAAAVAIVALLVALVVDGPSGSSSRRQPAAAVPSGWAVYRNQAAGVSVGVPPGWHLASRSLTPALTDPHEILALGSSPLRAGGPAQCANEPTRAIRDAAPSGVFISLEERSGADTTGPLPGGASPSDFEPRQPASVLMSRKPSLLGCARNADVDLWFVVPFSEGGRAFYLTVAIGKHATPAQRARARAVIDSLEISPGRTVGWGPWLRLPREGWYAAVRTERRQHVVQASTAALGPFARDLAGGGGTLGPGDLTVSVVEYLGGRHSRSGIPPGRLPVKLTRADFSPPRFAGQRAAGLAVRQFSLGPGRSFSVVVALGPTDPPRGAELPADADALVAKANEVLASLVPR